MLQQNTVNRFVAESVASGEIHLLVSGGLGGLATWNNRTGLWTWPETGSWKRNQVDSSGSWIDPVEEVESNRGILRNGAYLKGISVSVVPKDSYASKLETLKLCTRLRMEIRIGTSSTISLDLKVKSRKLQGNYVFFEVDEELLPAGLSSNIDVYFKYRNDEYRGYTCYTSEEQEVVVSLYPYDPPVESEEYNPILNNINQNTVSTVARVVEPFEYKNVFLGTIETNADHWYDGWFADWNSLEDYEQRLNGSGAFWRPGEDPVIQANAGGALGIYQMLPTVFLEKGTGMASIPDYYFTSIANGSGRWLGTKNAEYQTYLGNKREFTFKNLERCYEFIKGNVQRGNLLVSQDSPFVINTGEQEPVTADFSGKLEGTVVSGRISGSIENGFIEGTISGQVSNIGLDHVVTYWSSSVPVQDCTVFTTEPSGSDIQGIGTRLIYNSEKKIQTKTAGIQELDGNYRFADVAVPDQNLQVKFNDSFGTVLSWGRVFGSGSVYLSEDSEIERSPVSFKNLQLIGSGLQISSVLTGSMYIIPSGSVNIFGTVGTVAENLKLHMFNGQLDVAGPSAQKIEFTHADDFGVIVTNVETAEQSVTVFDSFVADSLVFGDGFGGQANLFVTSGKLNLGTNTALKVSLLTEDQETIPGTGSSATGSLHGVDLFMTETSNGVPAWRFSTVRTELETEEFLPDGTAILSGTLSNFTLQGTRTNLRLFPYTRRAGSLVSQFDTLQAFRLLANLETGIEFAKMALSRSGSVRTSDLNPRTISEARMPQKVYEAAMLASNYIVSGAVQIVDGVEVPDTDPIWIDTGSILPSGFNFYDTGSSARTSILNFITGSEQAITRLIGFMSGSLVDTLFLRPLGQYTYVYLNSSIPEYLKAHIQDFSGSYIRLSGEEGSQSSGFLSGSFRKLWGRFGEGTVEQGRDFGRTVQFSASADIFIPFTQTMPLPGIFGVVYGAFDYRGYIVGGYEGNMVEGTIDGTPVGLVSGITNGHIEGNLVNMVGTSRGSFRSTVKGGKFSGVMKDVQMEGNNLNNGVYLSGSLSGVEDFPFQGTIIGTVDTLTLPDSCTYTLDGFSKKQTQAEIVLPEQGRFTGELRVYPERVGETETIEVVRFVPANVSSISFILSHSLDTQEISADIYAGSQEELLRGTLEALNNHTIRLTVPVQVSASSSQIPLTIILRRGLDWEGVLGTTTKINLSGSSIEEDILIGGTVSGSLSFGSNGKIVLPPVSVVDTATQTVYSETSSVSGQFEVSGSNQVATNTNNPFSGLISPIFIRQEIQGNFDCQVENRSYLNLFGKGKIRNINGHVLLKGTVDLESGAQGNLVEGHDRPFFTLQEFSGSVFPVDTTLEALQNMDMSTVSIQTLLFTSGMALVGYSSGSFGTIKEQEYVQNTLSLPRIGDIVYVGEKVRVVSSRVYCPELHGVLDINDKGTVTSVTYLEQFQ